MTKSFEDTEVWRASRELVRIVYGATKRRGFSRDITLVGQVRRAAVSVMSNIAEGFERGTNSEFMQFLYIAKGSCGEVRSQLYAALDQGYLSDEEFRTRFDQCRIVSSQLGKLLQYLKNSPYKGEKHKSAER